MDAIFAGLNDKQIEAVRTTEGPVLVLSGPGSGKTRCLTHRIAYLIAQGVQPQNILAVTFTNKAAGEIKERVKKLLRENEQQTESRPAESAGRPTLGTFHSIGARILRSEIQRIGYDTTFTICDTADQLALVRAALAELEIDNKKFVPERILNAISKLKTDLIWPDTYHPHEFFQKIVARVYVHYQNALKRMNGVDFDDLIMLPVAIFERFPQVLTRYQNLWRYILVDEYQDTSHNQYKFVSLLAAKHKNLFCIGDDAQSIYMFREADIRNILNFQKDYSDAKIILLEQNYRSTKTILAAAQGIISNNKAQIQKELWTHNDAGKRIFMYEAINERDEARFIALEASTLIENGKNFSDMAILYRTHAQSRAMEEALVKNGTPYRIVGGLRFYERREIKDLLAYLRFIRNPGDGISFERIANVPKRGIGGTTVSRILAGENTISSCINDIVSGREQTKQGRSLIEFSKLIEELRKFSSKHSLSVTLSHIIKRIKYEDYLKNLNINDFESSEERIENIKELLTVAKKHDSLGQEAVDHFLEEVTLIQDVDTLDNNDNAITLMTMHASKGLEFPVVFVIGAEEGLFPHSRTIYAPHELEEERRLCYVALTRAKEQVYITHARYRHIYGSMQSNLLSRFVGEIPQELLEYKTRGSFDESGDEDAIEY